MNSAKLSLFVALAILFSPSANARFLQVDSVGYKEGINLYLYVGNDPANAVDPSGLLSQCAMSQDRCNAALQSEQRAVEEAKRIRTLISQASSGSASRIRTNAQAKLDKMFTQVFGTSATPVAMAMVDRVLAEGIRRSDSGYYTYRDAPKDRYGRDPSSPFVHDGTRSIYVPLSYSLAQIAHPGFAAHEVIGHGGLHGVVGVSGEVAHNRWTVMRGRAYSGYDWQAFAYLRPDLALRNAQNYECLIVGPYAC